MHKSITNLIEIKKEIYSNNSNLNTNLKIIAVCKTFPIKDILPLIEHGHLDYGENKVQEAMEKWLKIKSNFKNLNLHMIGKLQTNKVKQAVQIFDYIHSLDSVKLAKKISNEQNKNKKKLKIFIQVNVGNETQKSGIRFEDLKDFYKICVEDFKLDIIGLMCLPPIGNEPTIYFKKMLEASKMLSLDHLSMGMSSDYMSAVKYNASYLRIGSKILGNRN